MLEMAAAAAVRDAQGVGAKAFPGVPRRVSETPWEIVGGVMMADELHRFKRIEASTDETISFKKHVCRIAIKQLLSCTARRGRT
jgi:hypothetical protein